MDELFSAWQVALRRLRSSWRLMLVAAVGVLVASTLLAVAPIYADAMSDLGLRVRLERGLAEGFDRVAHMEVDNLPIGDRPSQVARESMDRVAEARVAWLAEGNEVITEERSSRLEVSFVGFEDEAPEQPEAVTERSDPPVRQPWGAFLFALSNFEEHVTVTEGRLPGPSSNGAEVVLPDGFQRHAAIGDQLTFLGPGYDDCADLPMSEDPRVSQDEVRCRPTTQVRARASVTVVGFVAPNDPDDVRWQFFQGGWEVPHEPFMPVIPANADEDVRVGMALAGLGSMSMLTTEEQYFGAFAALMPELTSRHRSGIVPDIQGLGLGEVPRAIEDLRGWRADVSDGLGLIAPARLQVLRQLEQFRNLQTFNQIPLLIILLQVVGIVVYYVVMVMTMLLDRRAEEIGVYRSRGASTSQLLGLTFVETLVLAIPAALMAPWLAVLVVRALGFTPTFDPITGGAALPASITPSAFLLAAGGAVISLGAMLLPSYIAARRGIVDVKREQARPGARNILQRYYLDLAVVALAGLLLWQLDQRGSVFDPSAVGGWSSDPLLLLSPLVFTLAVAAIVLRLYPPLLRLGVRILLAFKGTATAIGLRRAGRSPGAYARLMLLLVMAVSVGTFAASYGPTVGRSLDERVRYATGADLRALIADRDQGQAADAVGEVREIEGVRDAALVHRGTIAAASGRETALLAVDSERTPAMIWFREDFSEQPEASLLRQIQTTVPPGGGIAVPDEATALEVSVYAEGVSTRALVRVRFRDARGVFGYTVLRPELEEPPLERWNTWSGPMLPNTYERPLTLVSFDVSDVLGQNLRTAGALYFDDIRAVVPDGDPVLLEGFEGPLNWRLYNQPDNEETFELTADQAVEGDQSAKWTWEPVISQRQRVLALSDPAVPLSAIMSPVALGTLGGAPDRLAYAQVGDVLVPFNPRGIAEYFPTLDPGFGFVVVDLAQLRSVAGTVGDDEIALPTELWVDFEEGLPLSAQREVIEFLTSAESPIRLQGDFFHQTQQLSEVASDPTLQASGSGILVVAFIAVLGLSMLGFLVSLVLSARSRTTEFAVLRAVGSSPRQILRALLLEWGVVLVLGATIGVLLGRRVAEVMLSFLEVTEEGSRVLPPFTLETDWLTLGLGIALLTALVVGGLAVAWLSAMRRSDASELRLTQ